MAEVRMRPSNWCWWATSTPDQWCRRCLHNAAVFLIPYLLKATGVTKYPEHFRCYNCGEWRKSEPADRGDDE